MNRRDIIAETVQNGFNVRDEYKTKTVEELQEICRQNTLGYTVCALNIEGDMNIGVMARTASLLGCEKFYIFGRRKYDKRSTVGAQNYLPIQRIDGLDANDELDSEKFWKLMEIEELYPIFIEQGGVALDNINWAELLMSDLNSEYKTVCFVFGNESTGIPKELMRDEYPIISVPQLGVLRSFNVSAIASMVLWSWFEQSNYRKKFWSD